MGKYTLNQSEAEKVLETMRERFNNSGNYVNGMIKPDLISCDAEKKELIIEYEVLPWEINGSSNIHGGILSLLVDHTAGATVCVINGSWGPTASLNVEYFRPAHVGDTLVCTGRVKKSGATLLFIEVEIVNKNTGKSVALGNAIYMNGSNKV